MTHPAPPPPLDDDHAALMAVARAGGALCTVVAIDGTWSRRRGAQLGVLPDGSCVGSLADGCLEATLARAAGTGTRQVLRFGQGSPYVDLRLPCGSGIDVLVDPAPDRAALTAAADRLAARQPASLALALPDGAPVMRRYLPGPRLLALGSGPELAALRALARAAGIVLEVAAPAGEPADHALALGRAPELAVDCWTAIAVLFHDHEWERGLLPWALASPAFLVGAQGGLGARAARGAWLAPDAFARLVSPIGLFPHARTPTALALSICAAVVAGHAHLLDAA